MKTLLLKALLVFFVVGLLSHSAMAFQRYVIVNGEQMTASQLTLLDQLHGEYIPNGRYWLNYNTGEWGYEGGPAQGVLGGEYYGGSTSSGCNGGFGYDCKKMSFCEENPSICSPIN
jgi:hypothetical protein